MAAGEIRPEEGVEELQVREGSGGRSAVSAESGFRGLPKLPGTVDGSGDDVRLLHRPL